MKNFTILSGAFALAMSVVASGAHAGQDQVVGIKPKDGKDINPSLVVNYRKINDQVSTSGNAGMFLDVGIPHGNGDPAGRLNWDFFVGAGAGGSNQEGSKAGYGFRLKGDIGFMMAHRMLPDSICGPVVGGAGGALFDVSEFSNSSKGHGHVQLGPSVGLACGKKNAGLFLLEAASAPGAFFSEIDAFFSIPVGARASFFHNGFALGLMGQKSVYAHTMSKPGEHPATDIEMASYGASLGFRLGGSNTAITAKLQKSVQSGTDTDTGEAKKMTDNQLTLGVTGAF